jgi:hypothetical protein
MEIGKAYFMRINIQDGMPELEILWRKPKLNINDIFVVSGKKDEVLDFYLDLGSALNYAKWLWENKFDEEIVIFHKGKVLWKNGVLEKMM